MQRLNLRKISTERLYEMGNDASQAYYECNGHPMGEGYAQELAAIDAELRRRGEEVD